MKEAGIGIFAISDFNFQVAFLTAARGSGRTSVITGSTSLLDNHCLAVIQLQAGTLVFITGI